MRRAHGLARHAGQCCPRRRTTGPYFRNPV